jgi:hypothetical protein
MAVTTIREIRNNTSFPVTVRNLEDPADTAGGLGDLAPNEVRVLPAAVELNVPWCGDWEQQDFARRHIRIDVKGRGSFFLWQASHDMVDRVRVSMDGQWHKPGDVVGAFAAVGVIEELIGAKERTLVVNDFTVWLLPLSLSTELKAQAAAQMRTELCGPALDRAVPSVPKSSAIAFSMAGRPSDAFDAKRPGAGFLYRDTGKRYAYELVDGALRLVPAVAGVSGIASRISFRERRAGETAPAPRFDLLAASGGRVFAKEQGFDRFYFAIVDEGYVHGSAAGEFAVPSSALVIDPEFNRATPDAGALTRPLDMEFHDFEGHPATERWPAYRLLLTYGLADVMLVRVPRLTWLQLDPRPPRGGQSDQLFAKLKEMARDNQLLLMVLAAITGTANLPLPDAPGPEPEGAPPPPWAPHYRHVSYCEAGVVKFWRNSVDYRRVLDIGVGHVHHHEQYEGVTGGEVQPFLIDWSNPNWLYNAADHYRFMFGPVRDGDGYIDGTCNFYVLAQLKDDAQVQAAQGDALARRSAYAVLWLDEQSYFTQRWHVAHPDDHNGAMISMVERLHTNPGRYGWNGALFWCPFRTGHVGPRSRMGVAAQVIMVTGEHPVTGQAELYSINFSFGTLDRTWHWRRFPAPARYFDGTSAWVPVTTNLTGTEQVPSGGDPCVYPQTLRLREDMTVCVRGRGPGRQGAVEVGWWYQRHLPSTNTVLPPGAQLAPGQEPAACTPLRSQVTALRDEQRSLSEERAVLDPRLDRVQIRSIDLRLAELQTTIAGLEGQGAVMGCAPWTPGERPSAGYSHPWKFLPDPLFALADRHSHFGVYDAVDSRSQFYVVNGGDAATLRAGQEGAWIDASGQLAVAAYPFRFDWLRLPWPPKVPPATAPKARPSLFNPDVRLRIVERSGRWIAMHWDKRDDDLMPFADLPKQVRLSFRTGPELRDGQGSLSDITVTLAQGDSWVRQPPGVLRAYFKWEVAPPTAPRAVVGFVPTRPQSVLGNVWRLRAAALDPATGQALRLFDLSTEGFVQAGSAFEFHWPVSVEEAARLKQYCSPDGASRYATSIWFEDATGHVSVPEDPVLWSGGPSVAEMREAVRTAAYLLWRARVQTGAAGDARSDWYAARARLGIPPDIYL